MSGSSCPIRRVRSVIQLHLAAACLARAGPAVERNVLPGAMLDLGVTAGAALTAVFVAQVVSRYIFMEGMDGFAGGMTATGSTTVAVIALRASSEVQVGLVCAWVAAYVILMLSITNFERRSGT